MDSATIEKTIQIAIGHHQAGRLAEAESLYRQVLAHQPNHPETLQFLGVLAGQCNRSDVAVKLIRRAVELDPISANAYSNLGIALRNLGKLDEAIIAYRRAIALNPNLPEAQYNLGVALKGLGQFDEAIIAYRQAIALKPNYAHAYNNLGIALKAKGQIDDAIAAYHSAIAAKPSFPEVFNNLGNALKDKQLPDETIAAYRQAIALNPNYAEAHGNLGNALKYFGQLDESIAAFQQTLRIKPDYAEAHVNLALALLLRGDWEQGWREYDWRWKVPGFLSPDVSYSEHLWDGGDLNGRTILLRAEQGIGDTIQFIRYVPLVVQRGGRVFVEAQKELIRLLCQLSGVERWIPCGEALPAFDVQCPLLNLPRLFATSLERIPDQKRSLRPDLDHAHAWQSRMEQHLPGLKVGLVWAGSRGHVDDRTRSIPLSLLAPLATAKGVQFFSLQKGEAAGQSANSPTGMPIVDWTNELHDFADTAALVAHLDLIISVDTSVAHLAAAMGKPVWLLLPFVPDWRWLWGRDDSPWYPTMRLFRQTTLGDWPGVIQRVLVAIQSEREYLLSQSKSKT